jgi:hypothetical protein
MLNLDCWSRIGIIKLMDEVERVESPAEGGINGIQGTSFSSSNVTDTITTGMDER